MAMEHVVAPVTRARRDALLPALHAAHDADGWLSEAAIDDVAGDLGLARAEVYGVASFYGSFSLTPRPRRVRRVCTDVVCLAAGATASDASDPATIATNCLGRCEQAPATLVTDSGDALASPVAAPVHQPQATRRLLRRVGVVDPASVDDYRADGGL